MFEACLTESLNYHHLYYFWTVARLGSVTAACKELDLAQPTISGQLRSLESSLGEKLFQKKGRGLAMTEAGELVFDYANDIFCMGRELLQAVRQRPTGRPLRLQVGLSDAVPKLVAYEILKPAFEASLQPVRLHVQEGKTDALVAMLANHRLDVVLCDEPVSATLAVKAYSHKLGESSVTFFAAPTLADELRQGYPRSLHQAPAILPTENTALRRAVDRWFAEQQIEPLVVAEFEDNALVNTFARQGLGFVAIPTVVRETALQQHGLLAIGTVEECREQFYAISVERRLKNPAVLRIISPARSDFLNG